MTSVLRAVRTAFPSQRLHQKALAKTMVDFCMSVNPQFPYAKDIHKIFDNSRIGTRHHIFPPERLFGEFKMEDTFETVAQRMGELSRQSMDLTFRDSKIASQEVTNIISASSFPLSPALDVRAIAGGHGKSVLPIHPNLKRTPMAGIGCAGGVATLARAHEYLKCHPKEVVMTSSVECGSRYWSGAFQARLKPMLADPEKHRHSIIQETVAACLLGDGASNTILVGEKHPLASSSEMKNKGAHPRIVDSLSTLVPSTYDIAGHAAASYGFRVYIDRRLNQVAVQPAIALVQKLLAANKLSVKDISHWVVHPGGPKIVEGIRDGLGLPDSAVKHSWESLQEHGNCGSVSIMNVLQRTVASTPKDYQDKYGLMIAVGPGVMLEGLLLKW